MITDKKVRQLFMLVNKEKTLDLAALKSGMSEKTARKYLKSRKLPSQLKKEHTWRTRKDPFEEIWSEICEILENKDINAKTIFQELQTLHPGKFSDGQLRTFQRKAKAWRLQHKYKE